MVVAVIDSRLHGWETIAKVYPKGQNKEKEEKMEEKEEMLENQVPYTVSFILND